MKKHILFVDDDSNILHGMKRLLRPLRDEWEMAFVNSGTEALDYMVRTPVDVVVTDMRMPGMDGAQLLTEVVAKRPAAVRIVLSGQASRGSMTRALASTHQYLEKPCDPDVLKAVVTRATALQRLLPDAALRALVTGISTLPSPSSLYTAVTEALAAPTPSLQTISQLIAKDIGMTIKILQIVNSALFGLPHQVSDVSRALSLLGIDTLKTLLLSPHVFSPCTETTARRFALHNVWDHSFAVASSAKCIAQAEQQESTLSDAAFTAGLLHDCGALVLAVTLPDAYEQALMLAHEGRMPLWEAEHKVLGVSHAEVGAYLLDLWGFPDSIIEAVGFHHDPARCAQQVFSPLAAVHIANALAYSPENPHVARPTLDQQYLGRLGLTDRVSVWQETLQSWDKEGIDHE